MASIVPSIPCKNCGGTMHTAKQAKHGGCLQVLGFLVMFPAILSLLFGLALFAGIAGAGTAAGTKEEQAGAAVAAVIVGGGGAGFFFGAIPFLIIGFLLLSSRKVWKCGRCASLLERA